MITVISRPLGHKLTDAELDALVTDSSGEALLNTLFAHGLQDGDYVFIQSNLDSYNGFKYVDSISYNSFKLRESESGDYVPFKQQADVTYRISVLAHGWLSITQPIVYELYSDLWPINQDDISYSNRVVDSFVNAQGYTQLNLSQALVSPQELDFIELVGTGDLAGPYQIITVLQPWSVIINLAYSAANVFTGYEVVKYYNNYCINVEVWSGLDTDHPWYSEKPYEMAATLRFTPGEDGRVKFSISDILKGYIETRNRLTLDTLPNNLDFMTGFYIRYYETYDSSDGDEITTFTGETTSDKEEFEGQAVNSDMPFKSLYISHMSEYLFEDTYLAKWLILQSNPVVVIGYFFDISFLNQTEGADILILGNGELLQTILNPGIGVIRVPVNPLAAGQLCISAHTNTREVEVEVPPPAFDLSTFLDSGSGDPWATGIAIPFIINSHNSSVLYVSYPTTMGTPYRFNYRFEVNNSVPGTKLLAITTLDAIIGGITFEFITITGDGIYEGFVILTPSANGLYIGVSNSSSIVAFDLYLIELSEGVPTTQMVEVPGVQITEEICLTVLEECDSTFIPDDDIRLTEDGDFRILE